MHHLRVIFFGFLLSCLTACRFGNHIEYTETAVDSLTTMESVTEDDYVKWVGVYINNTVGRPRNRLGMALGGALLKQSRKQQLQNILPKFFSLANNGEELDYAVEFFADLIMANDLVTEVALPPRSKEAKNFISARIRAIEYYQALLEATEPKGSR